MLMTKEVLSEFSELIRENKCNPFSGMLKTGVDLGTANIVIAVTDENNHPVALWWILWARCRPYAA